MTMLPVTSKVLTLRRHCDELDEMENPFYGYPVLPKTELYAFRNHPNYRVIALQLESWVTEASFDEAPFRAKAKEIFISFIINKEQTQLHLYSLNLTSLPSIFGFQDFKERLKTVCLNRNALKELPEEFYDLTELELLDIEYNNFNYLSERIGQLVKLTQLSVKGNKISFYPRQILRLTSLVDLCIAENELKEIPEVIFELTWLKKLSAYKNQISEIGDKIGHLILLEELALWNNLIENVSEKIGVLKSLKKLCLFENPLSTIPKEICQLGKLEELLLGDNKSKTFPNQCGQLIHLKILTLSGTTTLTEIPKQLYDLPKTCQVDLRKCPIPLSSQKDCYEIMSQNNYNGPKIILNLHLEGIMEALEKEATESKTDSK